MRYIVFILTLLFSVNAYALVNWNNAGIWNEFQTSDTVDITLDEDEVGLSITANDTQTSDLLQILDSDGTPNFIHDGGSVGSNELTLYNSYTDASNYEKLEIRWNGSNVANIVTRSSGTGAKREMIVGQATGGNAEYGVDRIKFRIGGVAQWLIINGDLEASVNGNIGNGSTNNPTNIFYDGKSVPTPQSVSCTCSDDPTCGADATAGTLTLEPTSNSVRITNADPNGCDVTLSETNAQDGHMVRISVVSNAGGSVDFADTSGVLETTGALSLDEYDVLGIEYVSDRWVEAFQSNN